MPFNLKRTPRPGIEKLLEELSQEPEVKSILEKERLEPEDKKIIESALKRKIASSISDDYQEEEEKHPTEPHSKIEEILRQALEITLEKGIHPALKELEKAPLNQYPHLLDAYHAELLKEIWPYLENRKR